jgi:hypothetical protein
MRIVLVPGIGAVSVVLAGKDFADRNPGLTDGVAESFCQGSALVIEVSLGRDVVEVERIGVRLIREGRAMTDDDNQSSVAQRLHDIAVVPGRVSRHCEAGRGK